MLTPRTNGNATAYRRNKNLKRAGVKINYTQGQVDEWIKCSQDPVYFITKYVKIVHVDRGLIDFELWDFQKRSIKLFHENRFVITKWPRQYGKSTTVVAYFLWLTIFHNDQKVALVANKGKLSRELLHRYCLAYEHLPIWLQQGILVWNKGNIELENGSSVDAATTTSGSLRGESYSCILIDELAHIQPNLAEEFFSSVYPTISSGKKTKVFIVSTPNKLNMFYKLWVGAENNQNDYITNEVGWWEIPGRDEAWKLQTIRNIGEEKFSQEFECQFLGSSNTLISGKKLSQLVFSDPIAKLDDIHIYELPKKEILENDYENGGMKVQQTEHVYVVLVDTAEAKMKDYHAISVVDITNTPYNVVATYRSHVLPVILLPSVIYTAAEYFNHAYVLIEVNSTGTQVADILHGELEYDNVLRVASGNKKSQQITSGMVKNTALGVKMSPLVRKIGCSNLKTLIETDQLTFRDFQIKNELSTFALNNSGKYEADGDDCHDDLVMTLVTFAWLSTQKYFKDLLNHNLRKQLQETYTDFIEAEAPPRLIIDNGLPLTLLREFGELWSEAKPQNSWDNPYALWFDEWKNSL